MQARERVLPEGVGVDSHLEEVVEADSTLRRNVSHSMCYAHIPIGVIFHD